MVLASGGTSRTLTSRAGVSTGNVPPPIVNPFPGPTVLTETDDSTTYQLDGGYVVTVPKGMFGADPVNAPSAPSGSAPPPIVNPFPALAGKKGPQSTAPASAPPRKAPATPKLDAFDLATQQGLQSFDEQGDAIAAETAATQEQSDATAKVLADRNARIDAVEEDRRRQQESDAKLLSDLQQKRQAAVDAADNYKVDQNRIYHQMSTGKEVLAGISLALAGIGAALDHQGGRNVALDIINRAIDRDVNAQLDERDQLGRKADRLGTDLDNFIAQSKDRDASFNTLKAFQSENAARQIEQIVAQYAAPVAQAHGAKLIAELRAQKADLIHKSAQSDLDRMVRERELRAQESQVAQGWAHVQLAKQQQAANNAFRALDLVQHASDQLNAINERYAQMKVEAQKLAAAGDTAGAKAKADQAALERDQAVGGAPIVKGVDANGKPIVQFEPLKQPDGTVWLAPKEDAAKIRAAKAGVDAYIGLVDQMVNLRDKYGWESDLFKSDEWRKMQAMWASAALNMKDAAQLGALSQSDLDLVGKAMGTVDPTEVRDPTEGLRQSRANALEGLNAKLHASGFQGTYDIPEITKEGLVSNPQHSSVGSLIERATTLSSPTSSDVPASVYEDRGEVVPAGAGTFHGKVLGDDAKAAIVTLVGMAKQGNETAKQSIDKILKESGNALIVNYLNAALAGTDDVTQSKSTTQRLFGGAR
jgi:hypothetical protein